MSARDIVFAAAGLSTGGGTTPHSITYVPGDTTATWPAATDLTLHGIGGPRTSTQSGWSESSYPTDPAVFFVLYWPPTGHTYNVYFSSTGFPQDTDLTGSNLVGTSMTISWSGGWLTANEDPGEQVFVPAFSQSLGVTSVYTSGQVVAFYTGGNVTSVSPPFSTTNGQLAVYTTPISTYSQGPSSTLIVNGVTKTFVGQTAGGSNTYTDYTVNSGASTSGALSIPAGSAGITRTYFT